jgi:KaiC/GvpD/RAD55 family RecA-like ATPase
MYFDYDYLISIIRIVREFVEQYGIVPTRETMSQSIVDYSQKYSVDKNTIDLMLQQLDVLYHMDLSDGPAIKDRLIQFGKRQALRAATLQCATLVHKDESFEKAREIIDQALRVGENVNDLGLNFFGNVENLPSLIASDSAYSVVKRVPTMFPTLDAATNGGPGRKQVWVIMGLAGGGKSTVLVNFGVAAIKRGMCVVHYTLGDLQEVDVGLRYAARFTGVKQSDIVAGNEQFRDRAKNIAGMQRQLLIKYYPSQVASVSTLRSHLSQARTVMGFCPALVIVDYADELKEMRHDDLYQAAGHVYSSLNQLGADFDALVWTGSQVGRYSPKSSDEDLITKENISDSWKKAAKADGMISINQTRSEYEDGRGRIWIDKVRRGKSFKKFCISVDLERSLIREVEDKPIVVQPPTSIAASYIPKPPSIVIQEPASHVQASV